MNFKLYNLGMNYTTIEYLEQATHHKRLKHKIIRYAATGLLQDYGSLEENYKLIVDGYEKIKTEVETGDMR